MRNDEFHSVFCIHPSALEILMDYTTLADVKTALGATAATDDALLAALITEASRAIDRHCAQAVNSDNYFANQTLTDQVGRGLVSADGYLYCWPLKPLVTDVSALAYRLTPRADWISIDVSLVELHGYTVKTFTGGWRGNVQIKITYTGGFATLPADLKNAATLLAVRFYREVKSGVTDSIGVAELGTLQYTKALPPRVVEMLKPYVRQVIL